MGIISKTQTVTHNVRKDIPTPRVPIRSNYQSWKMSKSDALMHSTQSRISDGIEKSVADLFSDLKKSNTFYTFNQSSNIPCSIERSSYSSVTTTKTIGSNLNPVQSVSALGDTSNLKALQNVDIATASPPTIASSLKPIKSKVAFSETSSLTSGKNIDSATARPIKSKVVFSDKSSITSRKNIESATVRPLKSKVAFSETSSLTSGKNIESATTRPTKSKVTSSDRTTQKSLQNNNIVSARPAIRDCPIAMNKSITTSKITSSSQKVIFDKCLNIADEEFSPHFRRKSILDDMNILKTPVNDSLTRKTILTNVVPVTSLITEHSTISDEPSARNSLGDVLSKLDDSITQVEETQTLNSMVVKNISDVCTSLTPEKGSESTVLTKHDDLSTNIENINTMNYSRQDTESFAIHEGDLDSSNLMEDEDENPKSVPGSKTMEEMDEYITSIPKEIDLTVEDVPIEISSSNDINEESFYTPHTILENRNELEKISTSVKRKLYKDNETPEKLLQTAGFIIDLPPLISPMNSDKTIVSENVSYMTPDSTTNLTSKPCRNKNKTTNKQSKTSLRRKVQNKQISVKRKLRDISSPRCPCDDENKKEPNKRSSGRPRKDETVKRKKTSLKSETSKRKRESPKKDIEYVPEHEYESENLSCPKTRNMMINPRTKKRRSVLLLTMD